MNNDNNRTTHRGMIVLDQTDRFLVSITGHDKLYELLKSDKNCVSVFEPLSRFEFDADFNDDNHIQINELIRFDIAAIERAGYDLITPVIVVNGDKQHPLWTTGAPQVDYGDALMAQAAEEVRG